MNRNVCVVGDPAQTIYSFAGASSWDLLRFADEFGPLAADVNLNTDYRSTPEGREPRQPGACGRAEP